MPAGSFRWALGDVNYHGDLDSNDYDLIDRGWQLSGGTLLGSIEGPTPVANPTAPILSPPEAALLANQPLDSQEGPVSPRPASSELLSVEIGERYPDESSVALAAEEETWVAASPAPPAWEPVEASVAPAIIPDGEAPNLLALSALDVRL